MSNTTKTLSTGTLGLRFMQNAMRSRKEDQVELQKKNVKDEGEWEIEGADLIREESAKRGFLSLSHDPVTYEQSYLPFLFPSTNSDEESSTPRGRRAFDKHGKDVIVTLQQAEQTQVAEGPTSSTEERKGPKTLSNVGAPLTRTEDRNRGGGKPHGDGEGGEHLPRKPKHPVPVLKMISGGDVGLDMKIAKKVGPVSFLKPAGVDAPATRLKREREEGLSASNDSTADIPRKPKKKKDADKVE